jgi:hypothetical protein
VGTRVPTGILLVTWLVVLVVAPGEWIIAGLLISVTAAIRFYDLRRGALRFMPWPLTVIAFLMPLPAGRDYLEEVGQNVSEARGRERRRYVLNAVVASPRTLVTVWHGWLRAKMVFVTVRVLSRRVHDVQLLIEAAGVGQRRYRVALRRLRRYCRVILYATGRGQYREYAGPARALLEITRQLPDDLDADVAARINQEVEKLACVLTNRRPGRA